MRGGGWSMRRRDEYCAKKSC